jgi:hypothetical protein
MGAVLLLGCSDNPVTPDPHNDDDEVLTAVVTYSVQDMYTLTPVTVEVEIKDHHGEHVTDMESVRVEFKRHEDAAWSGTDLAPDGDHFHADHVFMSSGEYEMRVMAQAHGTPAATVIETEGGHGHFDVHRIFQEIGNARVEFETFPGHVHEGEEIAGTFWIMEREQDADGHHHGMHGLAAEVHCVEVSGVEESHMADEHEEGVYEAHHTFSSAGEAHMTIHFPGDAGAEHEVTFTFSVAEGH